jgi:hypothetical protein
MPRICIRFSEGEPNWDVTRGHMALSLLSAFNEAIARIKAKYDLDDQSLRRLRG